jgi:hypothetical protein
MNYQLKLKDGKTADLLFSNYFLARVCKLLDKGLTHVFPYLLGSIEDTDNGIVRGGIMDDLEVRAAVLAAATEANGFANGDYSQKTMIDGYQLMEQVENSLLTPQWGEIYVMLATSLVAESLPKDEGQEPAKKKTVKKKNTASTTSPTPA